MLPATSASTSSRREMLQAMTWASPPALRMPCATSSQASALREEITTLAPSFASNSADERPMPRLEPVMTATWPVRSKGVDFMVFPLCILLIRHGRARPGHPRLGQNKKDVEARHKAGHDGETCNVEPYTS